MKNIQELFKEINRLTEEKEKLIKLLGLELKANINKIVCDAIKENKIKRISNNIIIVKYSQLCGNPWSPTFYNWEEAGKILILYLNRFSSENWLNKLNELYKNRKYNVIYLKQYNGFNEKTPISAEFIKKIIERIYENNKIEK